MCHPPSTSTSQGKHWPSSNTTCDCDCDCDDDDAGDDDDLSATTLPRCKFTAWIGQSKSRQIKLHHVRVTVRVRAGVRVVAGVRVRAGVVV